jgi:hypothetical protein
MRNKLAQICEFISHCVDTQIERCIRYPTTEEYYAVSGGFEACFRNEY